MSGEEDYQGKYRSPFTLAALRIKTMVMKEVIALRGFLLGHAVQSA